MATARATERQQRLVKRPRNIWRVDHRGFRGWCVAVKRRGVRHQKYISDGRHGSRREALAASIAFRDRLLRQLPPVSKIKRRYVLNKTGIIGVALVHDRTRRGRLARRYVASWWERDRSRKRSFSVMKYGSAEARRLAVAARREAVARLLGPATPGFPGLGGR